MAPSGEPARRPTALAGHWSFGERSGAPQYLLYVSPDTSTAAYDRGTERRRAVALAHHFREAEGLSIAQIADRLGRSLAAVKAYFYDPTGEIARAVKARYVGCAAAVAPTPSRGTGKGDAYAYCKRCHRGAIKPRWTRELVLKAMCEWRARYGRPPSSYDWSRTHAERRGGAAPRRLNEGEWPAASVVSDCSAPGRSPAPRANSVETARRMSV